MAFAMGSEQLNATGLCSGPVPFFMTTPWIPQHPLLDMGAWDKSMYLILMIL